MKCAHLAVGGPLSWADTAGQVLQPAEEPAASRRGWGGGAGQQGFGSYLTVPGNFLQVRSVFPQAVNSMNL